MMNNDQIPDLLRQIYPRGFYLKDITGDFDSADWQSLSNISDPLVLVLKKGMMNPAVESLIMHGLSPTTSCMAMHASQSGHAARGTLGDINTRAQRFADGSIYLIVSGKSEVLPGSLFGKTVLVTRAKKQASQLTELLRSEGAHVLEVPAIEIVLRKEKVLELLEAFRHVNEFAWIILTSVNTVTIVDQILKESGWAWNIFEDTMVAAIGTSTADAVRELGGSIQLVPPKFQAESLAHELIQQGVKGSQILLPRAEGSRKILPQSLAEAGATVKEIHIYKSEAPEQSRAELASTLNEGAIDYITFTSSSTVHHFVELAGDLFQKIDFKRTAAACIGPITSATLREYGIPVAIEAAEFTIQGLVQAILKHQEK